LTFFAICLSLVGPNSVFGFSLLIEVDCVAMITYSKEKRLVEAGQDDGVIRAIHDMWFYIIMAGYFPFLHLVIVRVSQWLKLEWQMMFRKAVARFDRTAKVKPKQPFAVSKLNIFASSRLYMELLLI
jgi:hypothetical protein